MILIHTKYGRFTLKQAQSVQLDILVDLLNEAAAWIKTKGIDQWPSPMPAHWRDGIQHRLQNGRFFLLYDSQQTAVATIAIDWRSHYWPDDGQAGYVRRMAVCDALHGCGLGTAMLDWAKGFVEENGRVYLRLDCLASNSQLCHYYQAYGFQDCGLVEDRDYIGQKFQINLSQE